MKLFPERARLRRDALLVALVLSLALHLFGGGVLWRLAPQHVTPAEERVADSQPISIEQIIPTPVPSATPTPLPTQTPLPIATPTPLTLPSAAAAVPRLATAPRRRAATRPPPPAVPRELARVNPFASPRPRAAAPSTSAYTASQLASLDGRFRSTIASAQRAVAEAPAQTGSSGGGNAPTMKRYQNIMNGSPADTLGGGGVCDNLDESTRGAYTYIYWRCRVRYSDGYAEEVSFPWPFVYPRGHTPQPMEYFPGQPPPDGFQLPQVFALSRQVCYYYRSRCDAVLTRERAAGAPDYGTPP